MHFHINCDAIGVQLGGVICDNNYLGHFEFGKIHELLVYLSFKCWIFKLKTISISILHLLTNNLPAICILISSSSVCNRDVSIWNTYMYLAARWGTHSTVYTWIVLIASGSTPLAPHKDILEVVTWSRLVCLLLLAAIYTIWLEAGNKS